MNTTGTTARVFTTTRWSMVVAAGNGETEQSDAALEELCRNYWYPIYVFLRRSGRTCHDAEDLTQAFFERVLSKDYLRGADRRKGKFRSFLLAMLRHFLANHHRGARALKRGGSAFFVCIDGDSEDELGLAETLADATPELAFQRQWATTLLEQVVTRLRDEYEDAGKSDLFSALKVFLTGERASAYANVATDLSTTEAAIKMAVSRMRRRYGELLRDEISRTVATPEEVDDEIRALFAALS